MKKFQDAEKKNRKKGYRAAAAVLALAAFVGLTGCGKGDAGKGDTQEEKTVRIGLTGTLYEDMWAPVVEEAEKEGIHIELVQFSDFSLPNAALENGELEMNAFQHHAFLKNDIEAHGYDIQAIGDTFVVAMNLYSDKLADISELKEGDTIAIPNDASNGGRALKLLESAGIIKLKEDAGKNPEISDIAEYLVKVELVPANASNICAMLPDVTAAVINGNYALDFGLNPAEDAIFFEKEYEDDSYFCLIAVRSEDADNEVYKRIVEIYQSDVTKKIFEETFNGYFVPVF